MHWARSLQAAKQDIVAMRRFVLEAIDSGYDMTLDRNDAFTFDMSVLFTITIMSTVGYGHISPSTTNGQIFCIFYSLIGIPLLLVFMSQVTDKPMPSNK